MNREIQILLIVTAGVSSFSTYNSTSVIGSEHLSKPIVIPNITRYFERPQTKNVTGAVEEKDSNLQKPEPTTLSENYSDEEPTVKENSVRFSSRYSTKGKDRGRTRQISESASTGKNDGELRGGESQEIGKRRSFSDRSDELDSSEEEKEDVREYFDTNEPEEWKVEPTTNEPSQESPRPTSFQRSPHQDLEDSEITSSSEEEEEEEEEEEKEEEKEKKNKSKEAKEKISVDVYHNSGSKNYHSVQTPLSNIRYRGPHSFREDLKSEKIRTRLVDPTRHPPIGYNWPYSRLQTQPGLEGTNEVSDGEDNSLEKGIRKELEKKPRIAGLELAVEKDEKRFDEKRKYNIVKERERGKQKIENLAAEEEKDHIRLPFQTLKQYQVDEEPRYQPPKKSFPRIGLSQRPSSSKSPLITTPRNIFKDNPKQHDKFDISKELAPAFEGHHLLGPMVFNLNGDQENAKVAVKARAKIANKAFAKGLQDREKLDQDNLTNERIQKTILGTGSADYTFTAFNHLEESEEMYNAILANIQSVFGLKTQTPKSNGGSSRFRQEENRSLTWSLPLEKRPQVENGF